MSEHVHPARVAPSGPDHTTGVHPMTNEQAAALLSLCARYGVPFNPWTFEVNPFDLPTGYVSGWVGPLYVGCAPDGEVSS